MMHYLKEAIFHPKIFRQRNLGFFLFLTNSCPLETKERTLSNSSPSKAYADNLMENMDSLNWR